MAADPEFVLLTQTAWLEEKYWKQVLGTVVVNFLSPRDDWVPDDALETYNNKKLGILKSHFDGFVLRSNATESKSNKLSVNKFFTLRGSKSNLSRIDLKGNRLLVRRLAKPREFWERMINEDEHVLPKLGEWEQMDEKMAGKHRSFWRRKPKNEYYWITGLLLCQKVHIAVTDAEVRERTRRGEVPIGTIGELAALGMGVPVTLGGIGDLSAEHAKISAESQCLAGTTDETYIFGLELKRVVIIHDKEKNETRAEMTNEKPDFKRTLGEDDDDDDEPEIELQPFDEEMWTSLLEEEEEGEIVGPKASIEDGI